jgi:UDP-N-acetylmuramyl pentapeptide synthase
VTVASAAPEGLRTHVFADTEQAAAGLPKLLRAGDLVLMKASRGLHFEKLRESVRARFAKRRTVEAGAR